MWDSVRVKDGVRSISDGNDILSAMYSSGDRRWFLCSSRYEVLSGFGAPRNIR